MNRQMHPRSMLPSKVLELNFNDFYAGLEIDVLLPSTTRSQKLVDGLVEIRFSRNLPRTRPVIST